MDFKVIKACLYYYIYILKTLHPTAIVEINMPLHKNKVIKSLIKTGFYYFECQRDNYGREN